MNQQLPQLAREFKIEEKQLTEIWQLLPVGDFEEITYLEAAGRWIMEVSDIVNNIYPEFNDQQKTAIKLKLMGKLLELKSNELQ